MSIRNRVIACGLTTALTLGIFSSVALATPQSDLDAAATQMATYGSELSTLQDSLATKTTALEKTEYQIGEKQAEIKQTKEDLATAKAVLGARMRSSYKSGSVSLLSVILGADSIEDVISRVYYMDKIAESDAAAIGEVRDLEDKLNGEVEDLKKTQSQQKKDVEDLQAQVDDYEAKVAEARSYYDALDAQVQQELAAQQEAAENAAVKTAIEAVEQPAATSEQTTKAADTTKTEETTQEETTVEDDTDDTSDDDTSSSTTTTSTSYAPAGSGLATAYAAIGCPYVYGAAGPSSFDCSGLVCYAYGYARGRTTYSMIASLKSTGSWKTNMSDLVAGDLCFTDEGHVGIYIGDGMMIHAPTPGRTVCQTTVWSFIGGGTY